MKNFFWLKKKSNLLVGVKEKMSNFYSSDDNYVSDFNSSPDSGITTDNAELIVGGQKVEGIQTIGQSNDDKIFENPLNEPIVRLSLEKVQLTGSQLISMSVKELNKKLAQCPSFIISKLKRCRRTLKNRGYAKNCRIKRIAFKHQLEQINQRLALENKELKMRNKDLNDQLVSLMKYRAAQEYDNSTGLVATNHVSANYQVQQPQYIEYQPFAVNNDVTRQSFTQPTTEQAEFEFQYLDPDVDSFANQLAID